MDETEKMADLEMNKTIVQLHISRRYNFQDENHTLSAKVYHFQEIFPIFPRAYKRAYYKVTI